jgi:hypothetical protein
MKFDKETALKHKFWILLLVSLPLSLGAIFFLVTAVSGDISLHRKKVEADVKKYKTAPDTKTPLDIQKARHEAEIEKAKEQVVWAKAYEEQEHLFTWPELVEEKYNFRSGLFAQKIKVYRGKAEPPPETAKKDRVMHGVVRESKGYYIEVETKDKQKHKLFESLRVDRNISVEGDDKVKDTQFGNIKKNDKVVVEFHRGKYFYEPLTNNELSTYQRTYLDKDYLSQIDPLLEQVDPMTETGEGVVQLKGWFFKKGAAASGTMPSKKLGEQKFINYLELGWAGAQGDISEQAWLAQEDIWVQRELYRLIRLANDYVSKFERVDPEVKAEDKTKVQTFRNPYWELGLKWAAGNKLSLTLKNLQNRRQKLDVKFRVVFNEDKPAEEIPIGGLPLGPSGSEDATHTETYAFKDTMPRRGIYGVEQVLTWETAAVKRIDQISVGSLAPDEFSHSHRTFAYDQIPNPIKKLDANAPPPAVIAAPPPRPKGRNKQTGPRDNGGNDLTPFELIRNRYAEFTPQLSRRIPVSLALIVDQEHIFRVQRAFSNSKLRFLTTQLLMNRYTSSIRPQLPNLDIKTGPLPDPRRRFAAPPPPPTDELETNVELVIYGIVTLYERYPPPLAP